MVLGYAIAKARDEAGRYSEAVKKYKCSIESSEEEVSDRARDLGTKTNFWGTIGALSGLAFATSPFGAPAFGYSVDKFVHYLGFNPTQVEGTDYTYACLIAIGCYFFGSMLSWGTAKILNEGYAEKHLTELKRQVASLGLEDKL